MITGGGDSSKSCSSKGDTINTTLKSSVNKKIILVKDKNKERESFDPIENIQILERVTSVSEESKDEPYKNTGYERTRSNVIFTGDDSDDNEPDVGVSGPLAQIGEERLNP